MTTDIGKLLSILNFTEEDFVQIAMSDPDGSNFVCVRQRRDNAIKTFNELLSNEQARKNIYYGIAPVGAGKGRAESKEVRRIPAFWLDMDFKQNGLRGINNCIVLLDQIMHTFPDWTPVLFSSGAGIQAYWVLDPSEDVPIQEAKFMNKRFLIFAQRIAEDMDLGTLDAVNDPTRLFRVPGSKNYKYDPAPTVERIVGFDILPNGGDAKCLTEAVVMRHKDLLKGV